jgi:phosphate transport system substrate-binding protein
LAAVSRIPSIEERRRAAKLGRTLADHKLALDSVVFFTHPSNTVEVVSIEELKKIYKATNITWNKAMLTSDISSNIDRFSLSRESGTFTYFKERVMYGEDTSDNIIHIYTPGQILDMVASNPSSLGFCSLTVLKNKNFPSRDKVKILKVASIFDENGTKPILDDLSLELSMVRRGEYPLTRYVYLISAGDLTDAQAKFIDFMRSDDAQAKLGEYGLVGIN